MRFRKGLCFAVVCGVVATGMTTPATARTTARTTKSSGAKSSSHSPAPAPGFDLSATTETIDHHIDASLRSDDPLYRMALRPDGFSMFLRTPDVQPPAPKKESARGFDSSAALTVTTRSLRAGTLNLPVSPGAWLPSYNAATRSLLPGLAERVTARRGHIAWDFVLDRDPNTDLAIAADITGFRGAKTLTSSARKELPAPALRWADEDRAVRMGEFIVVDAGGKELYRALPKIGGARVTLTVPRSALDGAQYPVTIDPEISPEYSAADPLYIATSGTGDPAVSWNGTNWLVVWGKNDSYGDIYAARVSMLGTVLDQGGIQITSLDLQQGSPDVAWNGSNWLVVFADQRGPRGARVSAAGTVVDSLSAPLQLGPSSGLQPKVASNGIDWFVAYQDTRNYATAGYDIYGTRVAATGSVLDASGIALATETGDQTAQAIASTGGAYLVVWQDARSASPDIYGTRVSTTGVALDGASAGFAISTAAGLQARPSVAATSTEYAVAWDDGRGSTIDIYGTRVTTAGVVTDGAGVGKTLYTGTGDQTFPSIAWNGTRYLVAWGDSGFALAYGIRFDSTLAPQDGSPIRVGFAYFGHPIVSASTSTFLAVWSASGAQAGRITDSGTTPDGYGFTVSFESVRQANPKLAWNGSSYLVAWESGDNWYDVSAGRVSASGALLDGSGLSIASGTASFEQNPAVASNGTDWLVVWLDGAGCDIKGRFVRADGTLGNAFNVSTAGNCQVRPSIAWNGTNFLAVWEDRRSDSGDIYGTRITAAGAVLDGVSTGIPIAVASSTQGYPSVASNGNRFFVAWNDYRNGTGDVYGTRVSGAGVVEDAASLPIATQTANQWLPDVESNGTDFIVAWQDNRPAYPASPDLWVARVTNAGAIVDSPGILIAGNTLDGYSYPSVTFNGTDYVVSWIDKRNFSTSGNDVYAARLTTAGALRDPAGIAIATGAGNEDTPDGVPGPFGRAIVAYTRSQPDPPYYSKPHPVLRFFDDPGNDAFAAARQLSGTSGTVGGVNKGATLETGEGTTAGNIGGKSVWFQWTAASSKLTTIDTISSDFDTLLGVFTGSSVTGLTSIAQDDDAGGNYTSKVTFTAVAGTTYRIKIDGWNAASGIYALHWLLDDVPPDTTITGGPSGPVNSTSATFTFTATEIATFQCSLDGAAYSSCTSPASYNGLSVSTHTFSVRATDAAGNVDPTPATQTWTVDTTPPDTTITAGPSGTVASADATFTFTATEAATFECVLDAGAFTPCSTPKTYANLSQGAHTFAVRAIDTAGNVDSTPATRNWSIDTIAPDTTIASGPPSLTPATSATFTFTSEAGATFACALDGADFATCTSPRSYSSLADGSHTFLVRASDSVGNVDSTPASLTWTVDTIAPDTIITGGPAPYIRVTTATVSFSSEPGATFTCSRDGGIFASCASPMTYQSLADGPHTFDVVATDGAGNVDLSPAHTSWTVDTIAPDTAITAAPPAYVASTSVTFVFSSTEPGTFLCTLDGGSALPCTSPRTFTGLSEGTHLFMVAANDLAGNADATPASLRFTVDVTAPDTTITGGPSGAVASGTATFTFTATETASFACSIDGGPFAACASPQSYSLADGAHTIAVRSTDRAGNVDASPAAASWSIDTTPPDTTLTGTPPALGREHTAIFSVTTESGATLQCSLDSGLYAGCRSPVAYGSLSEGVHTFAVRAIDAVGNIDPSPASFGWTIDGVAPQTTLISGPSGVVGATTATFEFASNEPGSFRCSVDNATQTGCTSPVTYSGLAQGTHSFVVHAVDTVGNEDASPETRAWSIDSSIEDTVITGGPSGAVNATSATLSFAATKSGSTFQCAIDGAPAVACTSPQSYSGLANGNHGVTVTAYDAAGQADPSPATRSWTVDTTPPIVTITGGPTSSTSSRTVVFTFSADELGVTFQCDTGVSTGPCSSPYPVTTGDGDRTFSVRGIDAAGNASTSAASWSYHVDTQPPNTTITSGPLPAASSATATFTLAADEPVSGFECSLDNGSYATCTTGQTFAGLADGNHVLLARSTDRVGNVETTPAAYLWSVDTRAPDTFITSGPADYSAATSVTFDFTAGESGLQFECSVDSSAYALCTAPKTVAALANGAHKFDVRAVDSAGNRDPSPAERLFTIDRLAPDTQIGSAPASVTDETFASFDLASPEAGVRFECSLDSLAYTSCLTPANYVRLALGSHTFAARAIDRAGNIDASPATFAWRIVDPDATPPVVSVQAPRVNGLYANDSFVGSSPAGTIAVGAITITMQASDPESGIASVQFMVDGVPQTAYTTPSPGLYSFKLTGTIGGKHTVTFTATNGKRLSAQTFVQLVTIAN